MLNLLNVKYFAMVIMIILSVDNKFQTNLSKCLQKIISEMVTKILD